MKVLLNLMCAIMVITLCLMTTAVSAEDDKMKQIDEHAEKCADVAKFSGEQKQAVKDIETRNRATEAELKELKEATPDKQRQLMDTKAKQVEKEMKEALGEDKYVTFGKCLMTALSMTKTG